jgi:spore coat polysaccharide biosynthesis protein SpsF
VTPERPLGIESAKYIDMFDYRVFVQARMSSTRFPGKVLAPLLGRPMIASVLSRLVEVTPKERVLLVTSNDATDDPLADYVASRLGVEVFRGSLNNVVGRFQSALGDYPADWFVRICGDSPAIDPGLLKWMISITETVDADLISNVVRRTFPPGQSMEIVRTSKFLGIDASGLDADEKEHLTLKYYRYPSDYKIAAIESIDTARASQRQVVDTIEDMQNMAEMLSRNPEVTRGYDKLAHMVVGTK